MKKIRNFILSTLALAALVTPLNSCSSDDPVVVALLAAGGRRGLADQLYAINPQNGTFAVLGKVGHAIGGMTFNDDGDLFGSTVDGYHPGGGKLVMLNRANGSVDVIDDVTDGTVRGEISGMATDAAGVVYAGDCNQDKFFSVNTTTGVLTEIGTDAISGFGCGLAWDAENERMLISRNGLGGALESVNTTTGATATVVTLDDPFGGGNGVTALAFVNGELYGVVVSHTEESKPVRLVRIDITNGDVELVGYLPSSIEALATVPGFE